jgi:putative Holliday junction resolvase
MSRIMAIDFGTRRIGLAVSDSLGITAQGLPTIDTRETKDVLSHIHNIVQEKGVEKIVVGMPKNMNGSIGPKGKEVKEFVRKLKRKTGLEIETQDERLTSVQSQKSMREMGTSQKKKGTVDRIAATLILQSYLDGHNRDQEDLLANETSD